MILAELGKSYNNAILSVSQTLLLERRTRRTFTIDPDVSEKIDKLVGGHNLEVNVLVNKSIRRYIEWGRYVDSFKLVTSDPRLMKTLWSHVTVEDARKMGTQNGKDTVVEFILYYFRKFDLASVLKTFELIGAEYANAYAYTEFGDKDSRTIILRHSMGRSASAYYGASFKALCDRLGVTVELEESDDQLICKIGGASSLKIMAPKTFKEQLAKQAVERRVEP
ncbi:MAG TPA: hypothetical protein VEL52_03705 [Candidatus Bathyarchaeia archaeon]|nr:hypothetical protein [Candidatus Bathyarchaeia archaeon]